MADIRPPGSASLPTPAERPASPARTAAQRAFFQAALGQAAIGQAAIGQAAIGQAQGATAGVPATAATTARAPAQQTQAPAQSVRQAPSAEPPTRYLRPGSLIDIKV